jgi:prepilin-type processing-associated H-X9-DG protein
VNNLKQIGLAAHNINDVQGVLPPLVAPLSDQPLTLTGPYQGATGFTVFDWLLPFIEGKNLFDAANRNVNTIVQGKTVYATVVPAYLCPSEKSSSDGMGSTTNGSAHLWAIGNYSANYLAFGNPTAATPTARVEGKANISRTFIDGTSNTVLFAERYGTCGTSGDPNSASTFGNLWSDSNSVWRPLFCVNNYAQEPTAAGYSPCMTFQVTPNWLTTCESQRAQSPHPSGMNVCLADGSVRFVSGSVNATLWANACDPRDGNPLSADW